MRLVGWVPLIFAAIFVLSGCGREDGPQAEKEESAKESGVARSEVERGPVRVVVEFEPKKLRLSDEATLTLSIDSEPGVEVEKPPFGTALGEFIIRDFDDPPAEVKDGRNVIRQIYTLEPPARSGEVLIDPIPIRFTDNRPSGGGRQHTIETEGLTAEIAEVTMEDVPSLGDIRPPAGPVELAEEDVPANWWLWGTLAALVLAGGALAAWWTLRQRQTVAEKQLSPRELAYLELQALLEADLAVRDVKQYYVELTGIVRRYIERTTGIRAPEQTTEEFLHEISHVATFSTDEARRLKGFLESADLVKFAAQEPRAEDVQESFQRAKAFIGLDRAAAEEDRLAPEGREVAV